MAIQNRDKPSDIVYVVADIDVTPPPPVTVSGTIRDSTNQPLGGVTVTFSNVASVVYGLDRQVQPAGARRIYGYSDAESLRVFV